MAVTKVLQLFQADNSTKPLGVNPAPLWPDLTKDREAMEWAIAKLGPDAPTRELLKLAQEIKQLWARHN
jgi:hypothetical protein